MRRTANPEPSEFPQPHVWGTWIGVRNPQFKTHSSLGLCKNAVSVHTNGGVMRCDAYVYFWDDEIGGWVEKYALKRGEVKKDNRLYKTRASSRPPIKGPSQSVVNKTIQSIMNAVD